MNTKHCIFTQGVRVVGRGLIYLLGVTCAAHLMTAAAADIVWTNTSGGDWNVAANWSPNQVPGALDNAFITTSFGYTVTVTDTEAVNGLTLGSDGYSAATLTFTGSASMTINTLEFFEGTVNFSQSGTVGLGTLDVSGVAATVLLQPEWHGGCGRAQFERGQGGRHRSGGSQRPIELDRGDD